MHTAPMADSEGVFTGWKRVPVDTGFKCRLCGSNHILFRVWESNCGGYEDIKYHCKGCDRSWWVEGPDA